MYRYKTNSESKIGYNNGTQDNLFPLKGTFCYVHTLPVCDGMKQKTVKSELTNRHYTHSSCANSIKRCLLVTSRQKRE